MGLSAGIIGLPNVGKSTIFNALCSGRAAAENYPFCTIEPNHGIIAIPDTRLERICAHIQTGKIVPAFLELVDIAGLVRGASKGEGLGNQFLGHIKDVNAVVHVVRCFDDTQVIHVEGSINPSKDVSVVQTELLLKDLETVEKNLARYSKAAKTGDKEAAEKIEILQRLFDDLGAGIPARKTITSNEMAAPIFDLHLITLKPVLYVANTGENSTNDSEKKYISELKKIADEEHSECVIINGKIEAELADFSEPERQEYMFSLGIKENGLQLLAKAIYKTLGLRTFFTVNEKELHAWTIKEGATAPTAAGVVHSDFEKGFIKADVYTVEELDKYGSEVALRAAGKIRSEGRDYVVHDGDILFFKANP